MHNKVIEPHLCFGALLWSISKLPSFNSELFRELEESKRESRWLALICKMLFSKKTTTTTTTTKTPYHQHH